MTMLINLLKQVTSNIPGTTCAKSAFPSK